MNLNDLYSQPQRLQQPKAFKLVENRQDRRRMLSEARQAHGQLMENTVYRQSHTLGQLLSERQLNKDEILQIFKAAEQNATSAGSNRTLAGQAKDLGSEALKGAQDLISGAKKWVRERPTYQAVDTEYNRAMTALGKLGATNPGEANKLSQAIYKYRAVAKEYPRATGLAKWAILGLTGLATGGVGAAAAIAAIDAAVKDQDLIDIAAAGATGAAGAAMANGISDMLSGGVPGSDAYTGPVPDAQDLGSDPTIGATPTAGGTPAATPAAQDLGSDPAATPAAQDLGSDPASTTVVDQPYKDTFDQGAGTIDYAKPGPITYDSVGQKLEYGVPVNDKGSFIPPVDRGVPAEFAQQQAAYDAWKQNYLSRFPNAQQMSDGTMQGMQGMQAINPALRPLGNRLTLPQTESIDWASRVRVKTLPVDQLIEQKLTVMQWALNESTGRGMGSSVVLTPRAVRFVFENVGRYNRALCELTGAPTKAAVPAGKKSWFGRGLDAIGKGVDSVGKWAGNVGHNMITKVTADKLANAWNRAGENMDSDWLKDFLVRQGVPLEVVTDIWTKMSIPTGKGGYGSVTNVGGGRTMRYDAPGYGANVAPAAGAAATSTATRLGGGKTAGTAASAPAPAARSTAAPAPAAAGVKSLSPSYSKATYKFAPTLGKAPAAPKPTQAELDADHERLASGANESLGDLRPKLGSKRDAGKSVRKWRQARGLGETGVAEDSLNELSSDLLQRSAQLAKHKSNQAMDPKIHDALGGGYMNPLAKHYDTLSQKFSNKAVKLGQRDAVKKIASPAVMRKIGMAEQGVAEDQDHAFKRGDRVYVRNQVGSDRVIRVVGDQVYLEKMGRAPMRDVSRVNPGLGQQLKTAGTDMMRGVKGFVTGRD